MLGRIELVTRLLETDIHIDVPDHNNYRTPLMWAVKGLKEAIDTPEKENMVTKYEKIITQLVKKGANLDKEDYLEVTPRDILDELGASKYLPKSVGNRDPYILPRKMDLSLDADDTSDEEISNNVSEYNCKDNWEKFKRDKAFQDLRSMGLSEEQISDTFVCHFKGIQYLYAKPVNRFFYHDKLYGKNRLSDSKLPDNELIERWFFDALLATCKQVIAKIPPEEEITNLELREIINKQIDKALPRLLSRKRLILRQARLHKASARQADLYKPHEEHLKEFVESEKKAHKKDGSRKYLDEFKEKTGLKTLPAKRLIPELPHQMTPELVRQLSGSRGDNTHLIHVLVNGLLRRASLIVQFETFLPEGKEVKNHNIEDLIQVFDKTFYAELSRLRKKYSVIISRGIITPIYFSPFENSKSDKISELGLFRDIRIVNRLQKRLIKHDEQSSHVFGDEDAKEGKLTIDLSWNLRNTQVHTIAYSISKTNHMRVNLLRAGASADYPAIAVSIAQIKRKFPSATDAIIAGWVRQIVQGESVIKGDTDPHFKTLSTLAALLFICEPERNPAAFIVHMMMLDLIENGTYQWDILTRREMPMFMVSAVKIVRYVHHIFRPYMPYPYDYDGEVGIPSPDEIRAFFVKTSACLRRWWHSKLKSSDPLSVSALAVSSVDDPLEKLIALLDINKIQSWYPSLSDDARPYWETSLYSEDQIRTLLKYELKGKEVLVMPQTQVEHAALLESNLLAATAHVIMTNQHAILPLHINGNHWVGLLIKSTPSGKVQVIYTDPKGTSLETRKETLQIVLTVTSMVDANFIDLQLAQQAPDNGHDCGPFTVDNLIKLAKQPTDLKEDKKGEGIVEKIKSLLTVTPDGSARKIREIHNPILEKKGLGLHVVTAGTNHPTLSDSTPEFKNYQIRQRKKAEEDSLKEIYAKNKSTIDSIYREIKLLEQNTYKLDKNIRDLEEAKKLLQKHEKENLLSSSLLSLQEQRKFCMEKIDHLKKLKEFATKNSSPKNKKQVRRTLSAGSLFDRNPSVPPGSSFPLSSAAQGLPAASASSLPVSSSSQPVRLPSPARRSSGSQ